MSDISKIEYAVVFNGEGHFQEYCHGTYEEVEFYCEQRGWYVDRYLDNVAPSTVQKGFRYVGKGVDPCATNRGFDYAKAEPIVDNSW